MNKHLYRIVFNHALRLFQVVSELVRRPGRGASASDGIVATTVRPVSLGLWVAFGWIGLASVATAGQIATDPNAPGSQRPTVMGAPNVAPVINITTPSKAGVSRNTYSDFNVDDTGAVLNNSRTNTTTQLAGSVAGNPWLATGTAKIILNEVTGPNPSALNGYIEVAGDRAQVIVANPAGISCDGCGVINANRFTLTTGTPMLTGGALDGYRVTGGVIQINGKGMDASRADYADIIARAVQVNGGIWAPQLQVTTGTNQVNVDQSQVTAITGSGDKPTLALDVSALGGMYANKIVLLGTENGVGARNAGTIGAAVGDLVVTQDGRLENTGNLQSQANTQIAATGGVANAGTISASRELTITTPADVDNSNGNINAARIAVDAASLLNAGGTIAQTGSQGMTLDAGALSNRNGGRIGATEPATGDGGSTNAPTDGASSGNSSGGGSSSTDNSGGATSGGTGTPVTPIAPLADGMLHITGLLDNDGGHINAAAGFSATVGGDLASSTGLANDGGQLELRQLTLSGGDLSNHGGTLTIDGASTVHANQITNDSGTLTFVQAATIDAQGLSNRSGTFNLADTAPMTLSVAGTLDNTGGTVATNTASFAVSAGTLVNQGGTIEHAGTDGLNIRTDALYGAGGKIATAGAVTLTAGVVDHQNATLSATQVTLDAASVDNRGGIISASGANANVLHVTGAFDNSNGGTIQTNGDLALSASTFGNAHGTVQQAGTGTLNLHADTLNGAGGTLASNGALALSGNAIDLSLGTTVANTLAIDAGTLRTAGGTLQAAATDAMSVHATGTWDNTGGTVLSNGALDIQAATLNNTQGTLSAAGTDATRVTVTNDFTNNHGMLAANGATTVHAGSLLNQGGTVQTASAQASTASSPLTLSVDRLLDNSQQGVIASDGDLSLSATTLDNTQGTIQHAGQGNTTIQAATLNGHGGTIVSNGALTLTGTSTDLSGGTTQAQHISVDTGHLSTAGGSLVALSADPLHLAARGSFDNTGGTVATNGALQLTAQSLTNAGGTITAAGTSASTLSVAQRFDNTHGTLAAMGATTVQAGDLINQGGTLQASGAALTVTANGLLDNSQQGVIASDGDLTLSAATLDNTQGSISQAGTSSASLLAAQSNTTIHATTLNGHGGTLVSNGTLTVTGDTTDLSAGTIQAQRISIDTGNLSTAGGKLIALSGDPLQLTAHGTFDNTAGSVVGNGALALAAGALLNRGGTLVAAGSDASNLQVTGLLDNTSGTVTTAGATTLHAGTFDNTNGKLQAASNATLAVTVDGQLTNDGGSVQGNGALTVNVGGLSNRAGTMQAQQAITATIGNTLDNTAGSIIATGDLTVQAQTLLNRQTLASNPTQTTGLYGQRVTLTATTLDNTQGQVQARDALTINGGTFTNAGGLLDGTGVVTITGTSLDNTGGQLIQRGDSGALNVNLAQALSNTNSGLIGAEGTASIHAGSIDNSGGTTFARHDLTLTSNGNLLNRNGGQLQTNGALTLTAQGTLDNSAGSIDATGAATLNAGAVSNVGGQILAGSSNNAAAGLHITTANAIDNRGGTLGSRGGDLVLSASGVNNSAGGTLVAQRDLNLDALGSLNNAGGTVYATGNLSFQNGNATLDNTGGQFGSGNTATLNLAAITNANGGHIQANTVWLTTPTLNNNGGEVDGTNVHATLASLNGIGRIYGSQLLDAHITGDYTHLAGQRLESDGVLSLTVDGTLTNQGTLQTSGELDVTAANVINQGTFNASNANGTASTTITTAGQINNQANASIEGDKLTLNAADITNTSNQGIVGDTVQINANTLTNGRDLGTADAAVAYGEGFIGASQMLDLRIGQHLANLDGDIYSGGDINIGGRTNGSRLATLDNVSGRIQAEGDGSIAADVISNRRRFVETEQYTLSPDEQYALSSDRAYDNALSAAEQQREQQLFANNNRTTAENTELLSYLYRTGWARVDHVSDGDLAILDATYNQIAIDKYGQRGGYLVVDANGNPGAEYKQTDTYLTGTRVTRESADSQLLTGGNLSIDLGTHLTNFASTIAATGDLTISGQAYGGAPDARIDNIAVAGQYTAQRDIDAIIISPVAAKYFAASDGSLKDTMVIFPAHISTDTITEAGPVLAGATITGRNVSISGRDITNTVVTTGGGITALTAGDVAGPGSHDAGAAHTADAAQTGTVNGAQGNAVQGGGDISRTQGQAVHGGGNATGATAQTLGSANAPLPGYVAPNNAMYAQHGDPSAPFLITTAPRFANGPVTSSDYLLRALGDSPDSTQKRLGDGYYEQSLVLDQILQLTGRKTLNGGDGLSQYTALMNDAADQASQLGLQLGAPLTSAQIASLSSDIVWLVDQVVDGQHVLVPVVYLSKATADALQSNGALIAGSNVDINASGTVRNDGTITGSQSASINADTLINQGALTGGQQLAIATRGDTVNSGSMSANAIAVQAGGSVVNAPALDGLAAHGGTIIAGTGGVQIAATNDVINQGKITTAGNATIIAGRDYVQNAATSAVGTHAPAGSLSANGNAIVVAGRDAVFDQSTVNAGKVAYIDAGRDAHFTAATVSGGTGISVVAGQDIISDTVTDHVASAQYTKQGKNWSSTVSTDDTVRGSTFTSGGDLTMQAGRDVTLTAANVKAEGAVGLTAGRDINLATGENTHTETQDSYSKHGKVKTTTHSETDDTTTVGTTISGAQGVAMSAGQDITAQAAQLDGGKGAVQMAAGRDITLSVGENTHTEVDDSTSKKSGFWSSSKSTTHSETRDTEVVGTTINGQGVTLVAGRDVHATSAQISANDGAAAIAAGRDLTLDTASDTHQADSATTSKGAKINSADRPAALAGVPSGLLTRKKTTTTTTHEASTDAVSTTLTGDSVTLTAGHDMTLNAAQIGATHDVTVVAGHDLNVGVATDTYEASQTQTKKKTGLQESGGSVMYGKTKTSQGNSISQTTPEGSMIGSTDGSVTMVAGNTAHLTDATVLSNTGTTLIGKSVTIDAAVGSTDTTQTQKQSSVGIKAGLSGGVASAAMGAYQSTKRGSEVKDDRLKALYAAQAGYGAYDAYQGGEAIANGTDSTGGASLRIGIGASSASAKTTTHDDTAYGSSIHSNGNLVIAATDGDLNVIGSKISGDNVALAASNKINLLSQEEDHTLTSTNKNGSGEIGFSIGSQTGWYVSASAGKGNAHGNGATHSTTSVDAANTLSLSSGGDTTLQGAQATGKTVLANVGGDLNIRSEQDTNDYASKQTQAGGTFVYGYGGSASFSQGKSNSQYQSVTTVSGISAGEGGYDIHVGGNTDLKGGVIASTADASKNLLDTGSLTFSDIDNKAKYSASNIGISGGNNKATGPTGIAPAIGIPQGDNSQSTTKAGIANGTITVRDGNPDLTELDRNPDINAPSLKPIFDQQKVQERQEMGQVAGYVGMRTAGTIADYMANHATTEAEQKSWQEGGANKVLLHGLVGAGTAALAGGDVAQGAAGAALSEAASKKMMEYLDSQHITDPAQRDTLMNLASAAIGGAVGGGTGAATALQGEQFNRQLHKSEIEFVKDPDRVKRFAEAYGLTEDQAAQELGRTAAASMDARWDRSLSEADGNTQRARDFIASELAQSPNNGNLFQVTQNEYYGEKIGLPELMHDRDSVAYILNTVAKVDPYTYRSDPQYAETILQASGKGSTDGFSAAVKNSVVGFLHMGIGLTDAIAYPESTWSNISNAWDNLQDTLEYKGKLDDLHLMQGDVYGVTYDNAHSSTELGVSLGIALELPGVLKDNPLHGAGLKPSAILDQEVPLATGGKGLGGVVPIEDTGMQFGKGIVNQGKPFEAYVQSQLPDGTLDLNSVKSNFSTFDHLTPDGTAISTKTMDTIGSTTYQNPAAITRTLNGYVDKMVNFKQDGVNGVFQLNNQAINEKVMQLGIPYDTTADQMTAINKSIQYAQSQGVQIIVTKVK